MLIAINPTTGEEIHRYPMMDQAQAMSVVEQSTEAFKIWKKSDFSMRAQLLKRVAELMRKDKERLGKLMTTEMGKPIVEAIAEVEKSAWCADHYAEHGATYLAPITLPSDATHSYTQHLPLGTILGILPWNAPFWLAFRFSAPALMAGNTCLIKHDKHVPACAAAIAELFDRASNELGAPAGLMQNLPVHRDQVETILKHKSIQAVSLTGSSRAGAQVASLAASQIKPAVLELGGSDPSIIFDDADLDVAVETLAISRIINAGQSCIAAKRLIVMEGVYDAFIEKLRARLAGLKMGDPTDPKTQVGPIARDDLRQELHRQVQTTVDQGGRCLLGGKIPDGPGFFYPVTLLVDVTTKMQAACEETFGPIAVVMKATSENQALEIANNTPYGLAASIWTANIDRALELTSMIDAGQVTINGIVKSDPRLPSGGVKRSGYGRELGPNGIMEFVNIQQVWVGPSR